MLSASASLPLLGHVLAQVIHTTGDGPWLARIRAEVGADEAAVGRATYDWYAGRIRDGVPGAGLYGHGLIDCAGNVHELAPERLAAQHAKALHVTYSSPRWVDYACPMGEGWQRHGRDGAVVYDWWHARAAAHWGGIDSPLRLVGQRPNDCTLAVDLIPAPGGGYTAPQVTTLRALLEERAKRHGLPLDRRHVLGHEDIDPARRGTVRTQKGHIVGVAWDPGRKLWDMLGLEG